VFRVLLDFMDLPVTLVYAQMASVTREFQAMAYVIFAMMATTQEIAPQPVTVT